jgi:hypothetical protein
MFIHLKNYREMDIVILNNDLVMSSGYQRNIRIFTKNWVIIHDDDSKTFNNDL